MTTNRPSRWSFEAVVDPNDKVRLRGFIKNEIAYYNALLAGFASRLRTAPDVFSELPEDIVGEVAAHGYNLRAFTPENLPAGLTRHKGLLFKDGKLAVSDRVLMFLDVVSVGAVLHAEARRAMAIEMLRAHVRQADALNRTSARFDQVLAGPVELLHPVEARIKRHLQLPRKAVHLSEDGKTFRTSYNGVPIVLRPTGLPKDANWTVCVIRDDENQGVGSWTVEFRQESSPYLSKLTDVPFNTKKRRREFAR